MWESFLKHINTYKYKFSDINDVYTLTLIDQQSIKCEVSDINDVYTLTLIDQHCMRFEVADRNDLQTLFSDDQQPMGFDDTGVYGHILPGINQPMRFADLNVSYLDRNNQGLKKNAI